MRKAFIITMIFCLFPAFFRSALMAQEPPQGIQDTQMTELPMLQSLSMEGLPEDKLDVISEMIVADKPESDILRQWQSVLSQNSTMNLNSAIIYITQKATMLWYKQNPPLTGQAQESPAQDKTAAITAFSQKMSKIVQEMVNSTR